MRFVDRFWVFVQKTPTCWLWTAGKDAYGYGQIAVAGKSPVKAHRAAWMLAHGPITSKQHVLHRCDRPNCVRASHLFLGDQAANMKDAAQKGRLSTPHFGARKLSAESEAEILAIYANHKGRLEKGLRARLAARFGVSPVYISMLGRGHVVRTTLDDWRGPAAVRLRDKDDLRVR